MKYQTMPPLPEEEAIALEKSIREHGMQVPILMDEDGEIIDGHTRWEIAQRLGLTARTETREGLSEAQKIALSLSLNIDRRQLTRQQRREVIALSLKAEPEVSNREHARRTGVDDKTVQAVRKKLEEGAEIPHLDERTNPQGRTQPASKSRPVVSITEKHTDEVKETFDTATGEAIESPKVQQLAESTSESLANSKYVTSFIKALKAVENLVLFDADRIGANADLDVLKTLTGHRDLLISFTKQVERAARGLRLLEGGKK